MNTGAHTATGYDGERSAIRPRVTSPFLDLPGTSSPFPPWSGPAFPWPTTPWPGPPDGGARSLSARTESEDAALAQLAMVLPELLKRACCRPDYRDIIRSYGPSMLKRLEQDDEALKALRDLLEEHGVDTASGGEREPVTATAIGVAVVVGAVAGLFIGWFSE